MAPLRRRHHRGWRGAHAADSEISSVRSVTTYLHNGWDDHRALSDTGRVGEPADNTFVVKRSDFVVAARKISSLIQQKVSRVIGIL